jgi:hypothetical protein
MALDVAADVDSPLMRYEEWVAMAVKADGERNAVELSG